VESRRFRSPMCAQRLQEPSLQASGKSGVLDPRPDKQVSGASLGQALIPLGFKAVNELLQEQVVRLVGDPKRCEGGVLGYARWG